MGCYTIGTGQASWICGDLGPKCSNCGTVGDALCDYPVGEEKTCDRQICTECAHEVAPDVHYCDAHFAEWTKFRDAGGVQRELANVVPFKTPTPGRLGDDSK
jgi:hypothetical protein